jgi:hypothetical protein
MKFGFSEMLLKLLPSSGQNLEMVYNLHEGLFGFVPTSREKCAQYYRISGQFLNVSKLRHTISRSQGQNAQH